MSPFNPEGSPEIKILIRDLFENLQTKCTGHRDDYATPCNQISELVITWVLCDVSVLELTEDQLAKKITKLIQKRMPHQVCALEVFFRAGRYETHFSMRVAKWLIENQFRITLTTNPDVASGCTQ